MKRNVQCDKFSAPGEEARLRGIKVTVICVKRDFKVLHSVFGSICGIKQVVRKDAAEKYHGNENQCGLQRQIFEFMKDEKKMRAPVKGD